MRSSLSSVAGIIGPLIATGLFAYFISNRAPIYLPGAAFFFSSVLTFIAMALALRSFRSGIHRKPAPTRNASAVVVE